MNQPTGFLSPNNPKYVCKLRTALYGLKQALRAWYGKIVEFLTHGGYLMTSADSSLFIKAKERKLAVVLTRTEVKELGFLANRRDRNLTPTLQENDKTNCGR
ncbi:UNVERIFIED_CONTAM: Retrovirus-related Pol polyprotein from transposon RE1 [Sesamum latifolium]|uniref:Retrovirus-related Pol polyprotein from transposon RE1 n=1 Tax=Sesamum latifolium TaxID=2727402 RepID=A0AAW2UTB7_9LAMI